MPRRKRLPKVPDYKDGGRSQEIMLVQKTNPLVTLSETGMTLSELKILDTYLARIDSHDPDKRFVRLEKGQIEKLLGVTQIKSHDLEKRINNLFQTVTIRDERKSRGFTKIALFEKAVCYQDDDGLWQVDLAASGSAMEYVFTPENLGYLRYRLSNVVNLTSRYSYVLFLYLEQNRHMHLSWEVPLDELRAMLRCTADTYQQFCRFNDLVLKRCHKELTEKTDCQYSYEPVRRGRYVRAVRFTLEAHEDEIDPNQITLFPADAGPDPRDPLDLLMDACPEFSHEEMEQIYAVLVTIPEEKLPSPDAMPVSGAGAIDFQRYHYLAEKYAAMKRADSKKPVKNRFSYMLKILKSDAGIS
jgi:hypothetical protein